MSGNVEVRNPRGSNRKKFDEWTVRMPDGSVGKFTIHFGYVDGNGLLTVTSDSHHFTDVNLSHTDINELRRMLDEHVAGVVRREISDGWEEASVMETRWDKSADAHGRYRFSLHVNLSPADVRPRDPIGNRGETLTRSVVGQRTIVQRGHRSDFSDMKMTGGSIVDPEVIARLNSPLSGEDNDPVSRVALLGDNKGKVDAALATLEMFSEALATRSSFESVSLRGTVTPEEMVEMMRAAAESSDPVSAPRKGWL